MPIYWALRQIQLNEWMDISIYRCTYMERLTLIGLILWIKCLHWIGRLYCGIPVTTGTVRI